MRFFFALEIPEEDKQALKEVQNRLKTLFPDIKPTDSEKLHLTLVFVGEQRDEFKERLIEVMGKAVDGIAPFEVTPSYIDGFPNIHRPHTIWVGVKGDVDKLHNLRERLKDGLEKLELPVDERRFVPHIAIAKTTGDFHIDPQRELSLENFIDPNMKPINVTSIKLFESVADAGLHTHNTLAEIKLS